MNSEFEDVMADILESTKYKTSMSNKDLSGVKDVSPTDESGRDRSKTINRMIEAIEQWVEKALQWVTEQTVKMRRILVKDPSKKRVIEEAGRKLNEARSELISLKKEAKHSKANGEPADHLKEKMKVAKAKMAEYKKSIMTGKN